MKAVYYQGSGRFTVGRGEVIRPADGEVRLDVAYCGLCGTDLHIAHGSMDHRVRPPQVIGHEMAGTVAEVGTGVAGLRPGDNLWSSARWTAAARPPRTKASATSAGT